MPIKNYTTVISPIKTAGQIQMLLVRHGARRLMMEYDDNRQPKSIAFEIEFQPGRMMPFVLRANVSGCLTSMKQSHLPKRFLNLDHAQRVAWRLVLNWIEVQLAFVDARQAEMAQLFLGYAMTPDRQTCFDLFTTEGGRKLLAENV